MKNIRQIESEFKNSDIEIELEKINEFVEIQDGNYCRAISKVTKHHLGEKYDIPVGEVLLISNLNIAHDLVHAVCVRPHPRHFIDNEYLNDYKFLFDDFCEMFEVISSEEGLKIRNAEMNAIQQKGIAMQNDFLKIRSNPEELMKVTLANMQNKIGHKSVSNLNINNSIDVVNVLATPSHEEAMEDYKDQLKNATDILSLQHEIIMKEHKKIMAVFDSLMPYTKEMMIAPPASLKELQRNISKRLKGIQTLELYMGKNVFPLTICEGEHAPLEEKLTVVQEVLYGDVELSLFKETAVYFDHRHKDQLWEEFRTNPAFVDQIFPTQRCIVLMACNIKDKDYGDPIENHYENLENSKVFILVRNGENIHALFSPISSHLRAARLFPSKTQIEENFRSFNGKYVIDIDSLNYSHRLQMAEAEILHFKRFMILIAGLDHREKFFGQFYPVHETMNIFYPEFQDKYMNFIHDSDGEGMLPLQEERRPKLQEFLEKQNKLIKQGSLLFINTHNLINSETAPSCYSYNSVTGDYIKRYEPIDPFIMTTLKKDKKGYYVQIPVEHEWDRDKRDFNARVSIPSTLDTFTVICIDRIYPEDLDFYINSRLHRKDFMRYISSLKALRSHVRDQFNSHPDINEYLWEALQVMPDCSLETEEEKKQAIYETLHSWHVVKDGYPVIDIDPIKRKKTLDALLFQLNMKASQSLKNRYAAAVMIYADDIGINPLKIVIDDYSKTYFYTEIYDSDKFEDFQENFFLYRHRFELTSSGKVKIKKTEPVLLKQYFNEEYLIQDYMTEEKRNLLMAALPKRMPKAIFNNFADKKAITEFIRLSKELLTSFYSKDFKVEHAKLIIESYFKSYKLKADKSLSINKYTNINVALPLLMMTNKLVSIEIKDSSNFINYLIQKHQLQNWMESYLSLSYVNESKITDYDLDIRTRDLLIDPNIQINSYSQYRESNHITNYDSNYEFIDLFNVSQLYESLNFRRIYSDNLSPNIADSKSYTKLISQAFNLDIKPAYGRTKENLLEGIKTSESFYSPVFQLEHFIAETAMADKLVFNPHFDAKIKFKNAIFLAALNDIKGEDQKVSFKVITGPYDQFETIKFEMDAYGKMYTYKIKHDVRNYYDFVDLENHFSEWKSNLTREFNINYELRNAIEKINHFSMREMIIEKDDNGIQIFSYEVTI